MPAISEEDAGAETGSTSASLLDVSAFEKADFSALHWVNVTLARSHGAAHALPHSGSSTPAPGALLEMVGNGSSGYGGAAAPATHVELELLEQLELAMYSAEQEIDLAVHQCISQIPWALREIEHVRQRASALRTQVDGVKVRVASVESSGAESAVAALAEADRTVRRIEEAREMLRKVAEVQKLSERLDTVFSGGDLAAVAETLASLRQCLDALGHIEAMSEKRQSLSEADKRLVRLGMPAINAALDAHDENGFMSARTVLDRAGRGDAFLDQCARFFANNVCGVWAQQTSHIREVSKSTSGTLQNEAGSERASAGSQGRAEQKELHPPLIPVSMLYLVDAMTPALLSAFYGQLMQTLQKEYTWFSRVAAEHAVSVMSRALAMAWKEFKPHLETERVVHRSAVRALRLSPAENSTQDDEDGSVVSSTHLLSELECAFSCADSSVKFAALILSMFDCLAGRRGVKEELTHDTTQSLAAMIDAITKPVEYLMRAYGELETNAMLELVSSGLHAFEATSSPAGSQSKVSLVELSHLIDKSSAELLLLGAQIQAHCIDWTRGICIDGALQAARASVRRLSERLSVFLPPDASVRTGMPQQSPQRPGAVAKVQIPVDLQGGLRVLKALGSVSLKWATWKTAFVNDAVTVAAPLLELLNGEILGIEGGVDRTCRLLSAVLQHEKGPDGAIGGGLLWVLGAQPRMLQNCMQAFAMHVGGEMDSPAQSSEKDFASLLARCMRMTYARMFSDIEERMSEFESNLEGSDLNAFESGPREHGESEDVEDDDDDVPVFSAAPSAYAADIGELLMLIPQQIEPFIPDSEELALLTSPANWDALVRPTSEARSSGSEYDEVGSGGALFARRWIRVICTGTMEALVDHVCALKRLSTRGAAQVATDFDYVSNILSALGMNPTARYAAASALVSAGPDTFAAVAASFSRNSVTKAIAASIARARGVTIGPL
ncbi:Conserved oligomeric Golgi complex subunit 7 [Porphyridium purpureum]|uniref:Conserved oligomeric Golgi complex subunit 7 n=1 Tax=Porphyridium purpureum TaxID=35688 RepID=A0A5J4Z9D5_PORPP|nr:Conserved oligomeric Golgi complex subunit 7 [Porphyridium purpureum]|eukprot:POR1408..scf295_1